MKRKIISMFSLLVLLGVAWLSTITVAKAKDVDVADIYEASVTKSSDISDESTKLNIRDVSGDFVLHGEGKSYYWKFKIEEPSFVKITTCADIFDYWYGGDCNVFLGVDTVCPSKITGGYADGDSKDFETLLEKGTYYLRYDITNEMTEERYLQVPPTIKLGVEAQPVTPRTGNTLGGTKESAIVANNNKVCHGIISGQTSNGSFPSNSMGTQYFKISTKSKATLNYDVAFERYGTLGFGYTKYVRIQNSLGSDLVNESNSFYNSMSGSVVLPKAGTYYIRVSGERFSTITANFSWKESAISVTPRVSLKVTLPKKGGKKITGTATNGSNISIKVGNKTYKGKVTNNKFSVKVSKLKKGATVRVTASKSGYNSRSVSFKVR